MIDFTKPEAVQAERDRCVRIIQAARSGDIDTDLRTLIHFINSGRDVVLNEETGAYRLAE